MHLTSYRFLCTYAYLGLAWETFWTITILFIPFLKGISRSDLFSHMKISIEHFHFSLCRQSRHVCFTLKSLWVIFMLLYETKPHEGFTMSIHIIAQDVTGECHSPTIIHWIVTNSNLTIHIDNGGIYELSFYLILFPISMTMGHFDRALLGWL